MKMHFVLLCLINQCNAQHSVVNLRRSFVEISVIVEDKNNIYVFMKILQQWNIQELAVDVTSPSSMN